MTRVGVLDLIATAAVLYCALAYVGFPIVVRLVRRRRWPEPLAPTDLPRVSVLFAARNEANVVGDRIQNILDQNYPADRLEILVVSDASDDATDSIVTSITDPRVRLVRQEQRSGMTEGLNRLAALATGDVLLRTDPNTIFAQGCVRALGRVFVDSKVGIAVGEVRFTNANTPSVASGEGLYWSLETATKRAAAELGLLCVANGAVYAIRRKLWTPLPPWVADDAAHPLLVWRAGYTAVVAPNAIAYERACTSLREEYLRKVRIISRQVACARWIGLHRLPLPIAFSYTAHKLIRYTVPFAVGIAFPLSVFSACNGSLVGIAVSGGLTSVAATALLGLTDLPGHSGRVTRAMSYLGMVNAAAVAGVVRALRGHPSVTWEASPSTRTVEAEESRA